MVEISREGRFDADGRPVVSDQSESHFRGDGDVEVEVGLGFP